MIKFKKLDCELCKVNFPYKITYNNRIVDIVEVECPQKNFIVFESLSSDSQKIFYILNTEEMKATIPGVPNTLNVANYELKIGRGADSDVRVTDDISVSRSHAFI
jgi:pSer/pThr/pTyr-binding forkhead associated (FHA) protein